MVSWPWTEAGPLSRRLSARMAGSTYRRRLGRAPLHLTLVLVCGVWRCLCSGYS